MAKLTDESLMPFGKYKGEKMANVPAAYLLWLDKQTSLNMYVKEYIKENMEVLQKEVKQ